MKNPIQAPTTKQEFQEILFGLKINEGITLFPAPHGSEGFFLEKHASYFEWYWVGGENNNGTELEEEEEILELADQMSQFAAGRKGLLMFYDLPLCPHKREYNPDFDDQSLGDYEINGADLRS